MLIAVEGIDGAGKTSLIRDLARHLVAGGAPVTCVRRYLLQEVTALWWRLIEADDLDQRGSAHLAAADYRVGVERVIRPAISGGSVVFADKYYYSHLVYFALRGIDLDALRSYFGDPLVPDLVLHVRVPVETALARLVDRKGKPDLLECGLDYRVGLSIGAAFARWGLGGAPLDLRLAHFRQHQDAASTLLPSLLPEGVTVTLDATADPADVLAAALAAMSDAAAATGLSRS
ncbi:MAG TPA: hypothetical protein VHF27_00405 [Acidimicrobiales bacterium]|nr:hypothetical protein [Acidimicrobiales bacterium]